MPWALCLSNISATAGMWSKDHHLLLQGQHVYRDGMGCDQDSAHPGLSSPWLSAAVLALPLASLVCHSATAPLLPVLPSTCTPHASFCCGEGTSSLGVCQTPPSAFPSVAHLTTHFFPHPVLLLATREHVPAPQIVHSSAHPTLSPWGGLSLPVSK